MSCIYGPRQFGTEDQGWLAHFMLRSILGEPLTIFGDGLQVRDALHVSDAAAGLDRRSGKHRLGSRTCFQSWWRTGECDQLAGVDRSDRDDARRGAFAEFRAMAAGRPALVRLAVRSFELGGRLEATDPASRGASVACWNGSKDGSAQRARIRRGSCGYDAGRAHQS